MKKKKLIITLGTLFCLGLGGLVVPAVSGITALHVAAKELTGRSVLRESNGPIHSVAVNVGEKQDQFVSGTIDKSAGIYIVQLWVNDVFISENKVVDTVPGRKNFFFELPINGSIHSLNDKVKVVGLSKTKVPIDESEITLQDGAYTLIADEFTLFNDQTVTGVADIDITNVELVVNGETIDSQELDYDNQFTLDAKQAIYFLDDIVEVNGYDEHEDFVKQVTVNVNPVKLNMIQDPFTLGDKFIQGKVSGVGAAKVLLYVNNKRQGSPTVLNADTIFKLNARAVRSLEDDVKIAVLNKDDIEIGRFNVTVNPAGFSRPFIGQYSDKLDAVPGENVGFQSSFRNYGFAGEYDLGTETIPTAEWIKPEFYFYYQKDMEIVNFTMGTGSDWAPLVSVKELDPAKVIYTDLENITFEGTEYKGFKLSFQDNFPINSSYGGTFMSGWLKTPLNKTDVSVIAFGSSDSNVTNYKPIVRATKDINNLTQTNNPNKLIYDCKKTRYNVSYK